MIDIQKIPSLRSLRDAGNWHKWHKVTVPGIRGIDIITDWLDEYHARLTGGYIKRTNRIYFQLAAEKTFFKLTVDINN